MSGEDVTGDRPPTQDARDFLLLDAPSPLLASIADLSRRGFSLIPIEPRGKRPACPWKPFQERRLTLQELSTWFDNGKNYNVGVVTGAVSGVVVIDCDSAEAMAWGDAHLPATPMVTRTANGEHRFYRHPGGTVRNKARIRTADARIAIDVRGDGGYVVGPGSIHPTGVVYERIGAWPALDQVPVFDPAWIEPEAVSAGASRQASRAVDPKRTSRLHDVRKYLEATPPAIEGQGGDAHTFRVCCTVVRGFDLTEGEALELLAPWNRRCAPPWSDEDLRRKIEGARRYGAEPIGGRWEPPGRAQSLQDARPSMSASRSTAPNGEGLTPPDLAVLLSNLEVFIRRYVVLTRPQATTAALWVVHTHALGAADCTPYLQVGSATKRAGKTRFLEVVETLVARPWLTGRTSAAALVRKVDAEQPTLLLDESDAAFKGEPEYTEVLRGILNSGYKRSGRASICVGQGKKIGVRDFCTFGAKAIAGIGKLPDTIADRAIPITLRRRMDSEPVARWRDRDGRAEAAPLHAHLEAWAEDADVLEQLRVARPDLPQLSDRAADVWEPLLAIADHAGGDWPERARKAALTLMGAVEDADPVVELLTDIRDILKTHDGNTVLTNDLLAALVADESRPWFTWRKGDKPITPRGLARLLSPLDIHPDRHTRDARGYRVEAFRDAFARYLPSQVSQCHNVKNDGQKPCDVCDLEQTQESASVTRSEADSIGCVTHGHIEPGDTGGDDADNVF